VNPEPFYFQQPATGTKPVTENQQPENTEWKRMRFKKNKVWLATKPDGSPLMKNGKVLIKYQLEQNYEYWVKAGSVRPLEASSAAPMESQKTRVAEAGPQKKKKRVAARPAAQTDDVDTLSIYTDGASSGNPGPAGIGVVLRYREYTKEISEYIGIATNNAAELRAVEAGLAAVKNSDLPVRIFTDSSYVYGVLVLNWKALKNQVAIASLKNTISQFADLKIVKIKGHAGSEDNERADFLATSAIKKARA